MYTLSWLLVPVCPWVWVHLLEFGSSLRCILKEKWCFLAQQPSIAENFSAMDWILWLLPHFQAGFCLVCSCTDLVCVVTSTVISYVQLSCCIWNSLFPCSHPPPPTLTLFCPLLHDDLCDLGGEGYCITILFRTGYSLLMGIARTKTLWKSHMKIYYLRYF